jgi:ParB family chromosome partitioning protein
MPTATKTRKRESTKTRNEPAANGKPAYAIHERTTTPANVDPAQIHPSPYNVRTTWPEDLIAGVAASIAGLGQLQPLIVRPDPAAGPGHYELVDGELRWRACRRLGLTQVRVEIGQWSNAEAQQIVLVSAGQRRDLTPIEEALGYRQLIDSGFCAGPTELAAIAGFPSQGQISNRLGLLKLPAEWQARVISGEISPSHARWLQPYAGYPEILKEAAEALKEQLVDAGGPGSEDVFRERVVEEAAENGTRPLDGEEYGRETNYKSYRVFTPTAEEREQLGVIELEIGYGKQRKLRPRATNVALWEKLQAAHRKQLDAAAGKKGGQKAESGEQGAGSKKEAKKPPTAAEKRAAAEEEKRREREAAQRTAGRVEEIAGDWARELIAAEIPIAEPSSIDVLRLWAMTADVAAPLGVALADLLEDAGANKIRRPQYSGRVDLLRPLLDWEPVSRLDEIERAALAALFATPRGEDGEGGAVRTIYEARHVWAIADFLCVDFAARWEEDLLGGQTEPYFAAHTKDQLAAVAKEMGLELSGDGGKAGTVALLVARRGKKHKMPKELVKAMKKS